MSGVNVEKIQKIFSYESKDEKKSTTSEIVELMIRMSYLFSKGLCPEIWPFQTSMDELSQLLKKENQRHTFDLDIL